jgi:hypothetical protein
LGAEGGRADGYTTAQVQHDQSMRQRAHFEHNFPHVIGNKFTAFHAFG